MTVVFLSASCRAAECSHPDGPHGSQSGENRLEGRIAGVFVPRVCPPTADKHKLPQSGVLVQHTRPLMASEAAHMRGNVSQRSLGVSGESVWQESDLAARFLRREKH